MKTFTNKKGISYVFLDLPEDASDFELSHFNYQKYDYTDDWTLIFKSNMDNITYMNGDRPHRHLPQGNYELIGLAKDVSEEVAAEIVDSVNDEGLTKYFNYLKGYYYHSLFSSQESLSSLVLSLGLNNPIILKKI